MRHTRSRGSLCIVAGDSTKRGDRRDPDGQAGLRPAENRFRRAPLTLPSAGRRATNSACLDAPADTDSMTIASLFENEMQKNPDRSDLTDPTAPDENWAIASVVFGS
jgi:hypothetical protein